MDFGEPLSETDSKFLSNEILKQTGLVIGAKSIKNYSTYVFKNESNAIKTENPSDATLDTFARYVLGAPLTDEIERKDFESHYPYWVKYRTSFSDNALQPKGALRNSKKAIVFALTILLIVSGFFLFLQLFGHVKGINFKDDFNSVLDDSLNERGWIIKNKDSVWWNKRDAEPAHLALYTLKGDNWSLDKNVAQIKNLIFRPVNSECFSVETALNRFVPEHNWQQAGILLAEDSTFTGKMIRLSISYNDYFGGYQKPPEIIIQALSSVESDSESKPEEIAHLCVFTKDSGENALAYQNLNKSFLRIVKTGGHYKFLYAVSQKENFAFKEVVSGDFDIRPGFVGIFAIQGWVNEENIKPAYFDYFYLLENPCNN